MRTHVPSGAYARQVYDNTRSTVAIVASYEKEFLILCDDMVKDHGDDWVKEHKVELLSQWEYVRTLV